MGPSVSLGYSRPRACWTAAGLVLAGCRAEPRVPPYADVRPPWRLLGATDTVAVSVDTSRIQPLAGGDARVRLRYEFASPVQPRSRPGTNVYVVESEEVTECARNSARALSASLYDSAGALVGSSVPAPGAEASSMIGGAGPALCRLLRQRGASAPGT